MGVQRGHHRELCDDADGRTDVRSHRKATFSSCTKFRADAFANPATLCVAECDAIGSSDGSADGGAHHDGARHHGPRRGALPDAAVRISPSDRVPRLGVRWDVFW